MPRQGDIVLVTVLDPRGRNPKKRPAVIVTANKEITPDGEIVVAAISTKFDAASRPARYVPVSSAPTGHHITGLRRDSVVKCDWLTTVEVADVTVVGRLPGEQLLQVVQQIANLAHPGG